MEQELERLGLDEDLAALILEEAYTKVVNPGSHVLLLPISVVLRVLKDGGADEEALSLGLRQAVEKLRPHGSTILMGESLLSLARATRGYEDSEVTLPLVLEAIKVFHEIKADKRMGRAYLDLGIILKDDERFYDALRAFELASEICGSQNDPGGLAVSYYFRAIICRALRQEFEALQLLNEAEDTLPTTATHAEDRWKKRILAERAFNRLTLGRDDEALGDIKKWLDVDAEDFYPYYCLGNIYERRGDDRRALEDYCKAVFKLSQWVLGIRTDRFRRVRRTRSDFIIRQSLRASLTTRRPDIALALLELANTGSMSLRAIGDVAEQQQDMEALSQLNAQMGDLSRIAVQAVADHDDTAIRECQAQADWLVAEREFLSDNAVTAPAGIGDMEVLSARIRSAVP